MKKSVFTLLFLLFFIMPDSFVMAQGIQNPVFYHFLGNPYIAGLLITIGLISFVVEVFTPGFGLGGFISAICFLLFFIGSIGLGIGSIFAVVLFIVAILLIGLELIVPGFGLPGIGGIVSFVASIVLSMRSIEAAAATLGISFFLSFLTSYFLIKAGMRSEWLNRVVLPNSFISLQAEEKERLEVGQLGSSKSTLRPSGIGTFNGEEYSVITEGSFIGSGEEIVVVKIVGNTYYVREKGE
ncbi:hypothetical protein LQU94_01850 [Peptoniphilus sp. KCTC 25270]|uniref:NfeD family protein n=1 Tax=Peptoniphilus sp. KCTC 25270 TaxID=2897414 RepID=UPI001E35B218|nr:NfeD family protein [Peptoniphilus sp. KCTC 25270]MCD1146859.1 hypothetical protein [Peptoniphilus sp. KCTC 25270]